MLVYDFNLILFDVGLLQMLKSFINNVTQVKKELFSFGLLCAFFYAFVFTVCVFICDCCGVPGASVSMN